MIAPLVILACIILFCGLIWIAENDSGGAGLAAYVVIRIIGWAVVISLLATAAVVVYLAII